MSGKLPFRPHLPNDDPRDPAAIARRIALCERRMRRRSLLGGTLGLAGLAAFGGGLHFGPALARAQDAALPDDAAPADQQVFVVPSGTGPDKTPDFYESVYERVSDGSADVFSDPLVRLNRNFEIIPAAALEWSGNEDGTVWTFDLDPALMWNDGNPVTANDWVRTFQYGADPAHAWDFTWFFQGVMAGWDEAIAGEIPLEELGVRVGENENQLIVETQIPAPFLPAMLLYSGPALGSGAGRARAALQLQSGDVGQRRAVHAGGVVDRPARGLRGEPGLHGLADRAGQPGGDQAGRAGNLVHHVPER